MRFLCDHDVNEEVALGLRGDGHDVAVVRQALTQEAQDSDIWSFARSAGRIVITCNRDHYLALADAAHASGNAYPGLIIVKQRGREARELPRVRKLIERAGESGISGNINYA